jgi:hypothetical protein
MTLTLDLYRAAPLDRARTWNDLEAGERRRRAVAAARDKDREALWSLTEAYLVLNGASGTSVSPRTLKAYRWAVNRFLTYAGEQAFNLLSPASGDGVRFLRNCGGGRPQPGEYPRAARWHPAVLRGAPVGRGHSGLSLRGRQAGARQDSCLGQALAV